MNPNSSPLAIVNVLTLLPYLLAVSLTLYIYKYLYKKEKEKNVNTILFSFKRTRLQQKTGFVVCESQFSQTKTSQSLVVFFLDFIRTCASLLNSPQAPPSLPLSLSLSSFRSNIQYAGVAAPINLVVTLLRLL